MPSQWTDEAKQEITEAYLEASPTPENTTEIIAELSEEYDRPINSIRAMLVKAEVYVSKTKNTPAATASGDKPARKSKQDSLNELSTLLGDNSITVDLDIINKLTGKAAEYFAGAFKQALEKSAEE